tara:strand:- start:3145 stop:4011 length:867 start_codon:yes stop_codon:yes gene_type:complete
MIKSMTAFARRDTSGPWGTLSCEIRSVNHRYLEAQFRLPEAIRETEGSLRDKTRSTLARGKVDVGMRLELAEAGSDQFHVNMETATALNETINNINRLLDNPAHINALDILRWPGVLTQAQPELEPVQAAARQLFEQTLATLVESRTAEGEKIEPMLTDRLDAIDQHITDLRQRLPEVLARQQEQLQQRLEQLRIEVDQERLAQEMALLAQKSDVAEELDRLGAHVAEVRSVLGRNEAVGRRLDFLMQELNREANTLGSKSVDAGVTRASVELKVLIEQMREQVQNIE